MTTASEYREMADEIEELAAASIGDGLNYVGKHMLKAAAALREAAEQAERVREVGWRPIETAPKDGTPILAWRFYPVAVRWDASAPTYKWDAVHLGGSLPFHDNGFEDGDCNLTHWMPLPTPPETP